MKKIYLIVATLLLFSCGDAFAQTMILMKAMDGSIKLDGGSVIAKHAGEIDVLSNSTGLSRCETCGLGDISSYNIMVQLSAATISFKKLLLIGKPLTSIDVSYLRSGESPFTFYKIHMEEVTVESVQESTSSEAPIFAISLLAKRIAWMRIAQKDDGSTGAKTSYGWDRITNTAWPYVF